MASLARSDWRATRPFPTFLIASRASPHPSTKGRPPCRRSWLVTASSRGLGLAIANAVLAKGHRLVATARNPEHLLGLVAQYGDQVRAVRLDVTDAAAARAAVLTGLHLRVRAALDVVVNNAGYGNVSSIEHMKDDDFRAQIETNFFGVVNVTRAAVPVLRKQRDGHIIQVVDRSAGAAGAPGTAPRTSRRSGGRPRGSSELRAEVGRLGVRVTIAEAGGDAHGLGRLVDARGRRAGTSTRATVCAFMERSAKEPQRRPRRSGQDGRGSSCKSPRSPSLPCGSCSGATPCSSRSSSRSSAQRTTRSGSR